MFGNLLWSLEMRRKHSEVTDQKEIQRILSLTNIGRLATIGKDGYPYITPINFVSYKGDIFFHCAPEGEKLDNLTRDPHVCFEVDVPLSYMNINSYPGRPICHLHQFYHCVIIRGTASVVSESSKKVAVLNKLISKHENTVDFEHVTDEMPGFNACKVIQIIPASITAKSDLGQNMPDDVRSAIAKYFVKRNQFGDAETVKAMGYDF
jgi:nitroimidazol reductase NimA-like FMN-containing flavoprotein (pyridoxamine 5'-phosphate oxidase superfamily)